MGFASKFAALALVATASIVAAQDLGLDAETTKLVQDATQEATAEVNTNGTSSCLHLTNYFVR